MTDLDQTVKELRASGTPRERWLDWQYKKANEALDAAGVDQERVIDGVPAQTAYCRVEWLASERDDMKRRLRDIASAAGNPDPAEACRIILDLAHPQPKDAE